MAFPKGASGNPATSIAPGEVKNPAGRPVSFKVISVSVAKRIRRYAVPITDVCVSRALDGGPGSAECAAALLQMMSTAELIQALSKSSTRE